MIEGQTDGRRYEVIMEFFVEQKLANCQDLGIKAARARGDKPLKAMRIERRLMSSGFDRSTMVQDS